MDRERIAQSFCVPKSEIAVNGYDLSINCYKALVHDDVEHRNPREILKELATIEDDIRQGIADLDSLL